jgi:hypothetical protein
MNRKVRIAAAIVIFAFVGTVAKAQDTKSVVESQITRVTPITISTDLTGAGITETTTVIGDTTTPEGLSQGTIGLETTGTLITEQATATVGRTGITGSTPATVSATPVTVQTTSSQISTGSIVGGTITTTDETVPGATVTL